VFKLMEVSRHKSMDTLRGYVRRAELFKDHAVGAETVQNLGGLRCCAERTASPSPRRATAACPLRRALAGADLVHLDGAISPGRFHQGPPLIWFPVCCHRACP